MPLDQIISIVRKNLAAGKYPNEQAVREKIIAPILGELGWPVIDPDVVRCEFITEGALRVDYALCPDRRDAFYFVETKSVGKIGDGARQLFEYAFHKGVPLVLLTDGRQWDFYLPSGMGSYEERLVHRLDLLERAPQEIEDRLIRYLAYDRVGNKQAMRDAQDDYESSSKSKRAAKSIPEAWRELLSEADELHSMLIDILSEKTQNICGLKPPPEQVRTYLGSLVEVPLNEKVRKSVIELKPAEKEESVISYSPKLGADQPIFVVTNRRYPGLKAKARLFPDGRLTVLSGSTAKATVEQSLGEGDKKFREALVQQGKLRSAGNDLMEFIEDVSFESPSSAASIVNTCSRNGPESWMVEGSTLTLGQWMRQRGMA